MFCLPSTAPGGTTAVLLYVTLRTGDKSTRRGIERLLLGHSKHTYVYMYTLVELSCHVAVNSVAREGHQVETRAGRKTKRANKTTAVSYAKKSGKGGGEGGQGGGYNNAHHRSVGPNCCSSLEPIATFIQPEWVVVLHRQAAQTASSKQHTGYKYIHNVRYSIKTGDVHSESNVVHHGWWVESGGGRGGG